MFRRRLCFSLVLLPVSCYDVSFLSYKLLLLCFLGGGDLWNICSSATLGSFFPTDQASLRSEPLEGKKDTFVKRVSLNSSELRFEGKNAENGSELWTPGLCMIVSVSTLCRLVFNGFNSLCYDVQLMCVIYFERRIRANPVFILLLEIKLIFSIKKKKKNQNTLLLRRWD